MIAIGSTKATTSRLVTIRLMEMFNAANDNGEKYHE